MSEPEAGLRRSPLESEHRALGAHLGAFGGWLLPIEYEGTLAEHAAVRERVGVFDVSHLGKVAVEGPGALATLQRVLTNDLARVPVGGAQYGMALNEGGGIVDDLIVYRLGEQRFLLVPNAANIERVLGALEGIAPGTASVTPRTELCTIAPQGPRSLELVRDLFPEATGLAYMHCAEASFRGAPVILARTGYTGEPGFECFLAPEPAAALWRELLAAGGDLGVAPCGLGARDTLRLEMGYPLHGNDIWAERSPLEAGLAWAVAFDKGDFVGRDALVEQRRTGVARRLLGLRMQGRLIPRQHQRVLAGGEPVGEVTSGTFSPTLRVGIALAYLEPVERRSVGERLEVDVRGRRGTAVVVEPPFVDRSPR